MENRANEGSEVGGKPLGLKEHTGAPLSLPQSEHCPHYVCMAARKMLP